MGPQGDQGGQGDKCDNIRCLGLGGEEGADAGQPAHYEQKQL